MRRLKILAVGVTSLGSNSRSMFDAMTEVGDEVTVVDTSGVNNLVGIDWRRVHRKFDPGVVDRQAKKLISRIQSLQNANKFDVLFAFKAVNLPQADLLRYAPSVAIHYSADDVANPYNVSQDYLNNEHLWSLIVTTKKINVSEIEARSGAAVMHVKSAYDPRLHYPVDGIRRRYSLGFIGNRRPDRERLVIDTRRSLGSKFYLAGPGWRRSALKNRLNPMTVHGGVYGMQYARALTALKSSLILLNSDNRDNHTCRSYEAPACGSLFLGPRTVEHQEMLDEGVEAIFYGSDSELRDAIDRVLVWDDSLARMALAGRKRILQQRNTYVDRWREIRQHIDANNGHG